MTLSAVMLLSLPAASVSLIVRRGSDPVLPGYGRPNTSETTTVLNRGFDEVLAVPDLSDLTQLLGFDAVWVDTDDRILSLSATEVTNLQAFAQTGRPVVLFGENTVWNSWNQSITSVAGASADPSTNTSGSLLVSELHALTLGVTHISVATAGLVDGSGVSLFDEPVVMLFDESILLVLDSGLFADTTSFVGLDHGQNRAFRNNVVSWLGGDPLAVPEPASALLVALGLGLVGLRPPRRR